MIKPAIVSVALLAAVPAIADEYLETRLLGVREVAVPSHSDDRRFIDAALQRASRVSARLNKTRGASPQARQHAVELKWPVREAIGFGDPSVQAISNFMDHDAAEGDEAIEDWNCGAPNARTYDGHNGLDIFLGPFSWYQMERDSGIVIAAAAGTIIDKVGDQPERSCTVDNSGGENNLVIIEHGDGSWGIYAHMRTGSLTAKPVGASVEEGEYLGVVGSSGYSTGPHLHFEVGFWEGSSWVPQDPWSGACNLVNDDTWWENEPPYYVPAVMGIATHDAAPEVPDCPDTETPHYQDEFDPGDTVTFSATLRDWREGDTADIRILRPDGSLAAPTQLEGTAPHYPSALYTLSLELPAAAMAGQWTYELEYAGQTVEHAFWVADSRPGAPSVGAGNNRYNGLWYDPALDGEGYNIITTPRGTAIYFYGSDERGERLWLLSEILPEPFLAGTEYDIAMLESTGGTHAEPVPSGRGLAYWGLLKLRFTACDRGTASLEGDDGVKTSSIRKIVGVPGSECVSAPQNDRSRFSGVWFDPDLEGEGFNLVVTPRGTVLYYYGFDQSGERLWLLTAPFEFSYADGAEIEVELLKATSGTFASPTAPATALQPWGDVRVIGESCNRMRYELDTDEGVKVMNARRLVSVVGLGC